MLSRLMKSCLATIGECLTAFFVLGLELESHSKSAIVRVAGKGPVAILVGNDTRIVSVVCVGHLP